MNPSFNTRHGNGLLPAEADILSPCDDRIFKVLMTHPDAKQILIDVITAVIEIPVVDVLIRNNEIPKMNTDTKAERLDVNCVINNGDQVDVEMYSCSPEEFGPNHVNFRNKTMYYLNDFNASQKSRGKNYYEMVKSYQITFCNFPVFPKWPGFFTGLPCEQKMAGSSAT